jgi:hypothetical protein
MTPKPRLEVEGEDVRKDARHNFQIKEGSSRRLLIFALLECSRMIAFE